MNEPIVFVSYSHKNEADKEELLSHLKVLTKLGLIQAWTDDDIDAGERWKNAIQQAMRNARIAILLVTKDFLGSDFILDQEVPELLQRLELAEDKKLTVIPLIARACYWKAHEWLEQMQVRPKGAKPIWSLPDNERDEILAGLTEEIAGIIKPKSEAGKADKPKPFVHEIRAASDTPPPEIKQPRPAIALAEAEPRSRTSAEGVNLIKPAMLRYDATIPQCLDNQYISDEVYEYMVKNGADYTDPKVDRWRERDTNTEFIRSLVYSSQVVINRAFLKNNKFLYKNFSEGSEHLDAFAELVRSEVIVPYLYKEKTLLDQTPFEVRDEGDKAIRTLVEKIGGDVTCVRLAIPDAENESQIEYLESNFGTYFLGLPAYRPTQIKEMIGELFGMRQSSPQVSEFRPHLIALKESVERCLNRHPKSILFRGELYKDLFIAGDEEDKGKNTTLGRFHGPTNHSPFSFELKKLVDLRYNSNLPDFLKRYTFTPVNMPSRLALQDGVKAVREIESKKAVSLIDELRTHFIQIQREFMAKAHKGMNLPFLGELSVADVIEARKLDEWHDFALYQQEILREPLEILDRLEIFQYKFEKFQNAMSDWYYRTYPERRRSERFANYVTLAIQAGGQLVALGVDPRFDNLQGSARTYQPELLKGIEINDYDLLLMVNVIDLKEQKLDRDRSYSIEIVRNDAGMKGEKLLDLINSFKAIGGDAVNYSAASDLAEQG